MGRNVQLNGGFNLGEAMVYGDALRSPKFASVGTRHRREARFLPGIEWSYNNAAADATAVNAAAEFDANPFLSVDLQGIHITEDGSKMYLSDESGVSSDDDIYYFDLSTPWDITTATRDVSKSWVSVSLGDLVSSLFVSPGGEYLFYQNNGSNGSIRRRTLTTPYDASTASSSTNFSLGSSTGNSCFAWSPDGLYCLVFQQSAGAYGSGNDTFIMFGPLATPWLLQGTDPRAEILSANVAGTPGTGGVNSQAGLHLSSDGRSVLVLTGSDSIQEATMSTPFDISTMAWKAPKIWYARGAAGTNFSPQDMHVKADGTQLWIATNAESVTMYHTGGSQNQLV